MSNQPNMATAIHTATKAIKCAVWDLDNTIWNGTLLEDEDVLLRDGAARVIRMLDSRGILQSVASRNHFEDAMKALDRFDLRKYFLHPQVNWGSKVASIHTIAKLFNIGVDSIAFIDDQPVERDEVKFALPDVLCLDPTDLAGLPDMPELNPRFITDESRIRRQMYIADIDRRAAEEEFAGSQESFLATLRMTFSISSATEADLERAEELTQRTHQLNTTGYTYSYNELNAFRQSRRHKLLIAGLEDRYGTYGKIGLALVQCEETAWTIKLLLMSCRVMSRGVGTIMLSHIMRLAKNAGVRLRADFVANGRNRMMYVTYKFAGFGEREARNGVTILESDLARIQQTPEYVKVRIVE